MPTHCFSQDVLDMIERHLPDEPKSLKAIYESGNRTWAMVTWRNALNYLSQIGVATRTTEPNGYGDNFRYLYRKAG